MWQANIIRMQHLRFNLKSAARLVDGLRVERRRKTGEQCTRAEHAPETCMHERGTEFPVNGGMLPFDESTSARECALVDPH